MKELSMHILDIASNSVRGEATNILIEVNENIKDNKFEFLIEDDGIGIPDEIFKDIRNPFTTSRTLRKVGLGIPLLEDTCQLCNGRLDIETQVGNGTKLFATMDYDSIDRPPLGDIVSTIVGLMISNENINITYKHQYDDKVFDLATSELKETLGEVPLSDIAVVKWLKDFVKENLQALQE